MIELRGERQSRAFLVSLVKIAHGVEAAAAETLLSEVVKILGEECKE